MRLTSLPPLFPTDIEVAQYKAENVLLRREKDTLTQELRKAKGTAEFSGDRLTSTESETRRIKSQAQVWHLFRVLSYGRSSVGTHRI